MQEYRQSATMIMLNDCAMPKISIIASFLMESVASDLYAELFTK
jgi:hypothetical protein